MVTLSSDVRLARGVTPRYPPICPRCLGASPNDIYEIKRARMFSWLMFLSPLLELIAPGRCEQVHVPACRDCVAAMRKQRLVRELFGYACVAVAIVLAVWLGLEFGRRNKWLFVVVAVVAFLPQIAWEVFSARTVDLTVFRSTVDYEFRDATYAAEFAELNDGTVT